MTKWFQIISLMVFVLLISCDPKDQSDFSVPEEHFTGETPRPVDEANIVLLLNSGTYDERINALSIVHLLDVDRQEIIPLMVENLSYQNYQVRRVAVYALGKMGKDSEVALSDMVKALRTDFVHVRRAAAEALGWIGHESVIPSLAESLNDEDAWVSINAAEAIEIILNKDFTEHASGLLNEDHIPFIVLEARAWWQREGQYQVWPSFPL